MAETHGYIYSDLLCFGNYAEKKEIANRPLESLISDIIIPYEKDVIAKSRVILLNFLDTQGKRYYKPR